MQSGVPEIYDVLRCDPCNGAGETEAGDYCPSCLSQHRCPECTTSVFFNSNHSFFYECPTCGFQTQADLRRQVEARLAGRSEVSEKVLALLASA